MKLFLVLLTITFYPCLAQHQKFKEENIKITKDFYSQNSLDSVSFEIDKLGLNPNQTLLDIGSGNTFFTCEIARKYPDMNFILEDIYELQAFNGKLRRINWIVNNNVNCSALKGRSKFVTGRKSKIPLESNSQSQILIRKTFHEFKEPELIIKDLYRVLKPGGKIIIVEFEPSYANEKDQGCGFLYISEKQIIKYFNGFKHLGSEYIDVNEHKKYIISFQK